MVLADPAGALSGRAHTGSGMEKDLFLQACREGELAMARAMRQIYRDYEPRLRFEASKALADASSVHDAVQECLLKAWKSRATFRGDSELFPWLKTILHRVILDKLHEHPPESPLFTEDGKVRDEVEARLRDFRGATDDPTGESAQRKQAVEEFVRAFAAFAAKYRICAEIFRWLVEDGLKPAQIAERLGKSDAAARQQLSDCRARLRRYLPERPARRAARTAGKPDAD